MAALHLHVHHQLRAPARASSAAFYASAVDAGALRGEIREFAEIVAGHERKHVEFLENALGRRASERPVFEFGSATKERRRFLDAAVLLENSGVAAYKGQAANLKIF